MIPAIQVRRLTPNGGPALRVNLTGVSLPLGQLSGCITGVPLPRSVSVVVVLAGHPVSCQPR